MEPYQEQCPFVSYTRLWRFPLITSGNRHKRRHGAGRWRQSALGGGANRWGVCELWRQLVVVAPIAQAFVILPQDGKNVEKFCHLVCRLNINSIALVVARLTSSWQGAAYDARAAPERRPTSRSPSCAPQAIVDLRCTTVVVPIL
eukprot:SAG11_NODE_4038_length_2094_cov_2.142356_3_plen_145_part_00